MKNKWNVKKRVVFILLVLPMVLLSGFLWGENLTIAPVGKLNPGWHTNVFVAGQYIYSAAGSAGITILDGQDPTHPVKIAHIDLTGNAVDIYVSGQYAYVADSQCGMRVFDISNPRAPLPVSIYPAKKASSIFVQGNYAYLGVNYYGVMIIDITHPQSPAKVSQLFDEGGNYGYGGGGEINVFVKGSYAYMLSRYYDPADQNTTTIPSPNADSPAGYAEGMFWIYDISNPLTPKKTGYCNVDSYFKDIYISGNEAYLSDSAIDSGFQIVDISNPAAPVLSGSHNPGHTASGVVVVGHYAYSLVGSDHELQVVDISVPRAPVKVGSCSWDIAGSGLFVRDNYIYVADGVYGVKTINISNPTAPVLAGNYQAEGVQYPQKVITAGNYAYVLNLIYNSGLHIYNISNPSAPVEAGEYLTNSNPEDLFLNGNYAYITTASEFLIVDISNPTHPLRVGSYATATSYNDKKISVSGHYAYISTEHQGLLILDITNPASPLLKSTWTPNRPIYDMTLSGDYVFLTISSPDYNGKVIVLNIADPATPTEIKSCEIPFSVYRNFQWGNYLFLASDLKNCILDISTPSAPVLLESEGIPTTFYDMAFVDAYAFIATQKQGVAVYDIRNLSAPVLVGQYSSILSTRAISVKNGLIYVAADGFEILSYQTAASLPRIHLDHNSLNFTAVANQQVSGSQSLIISNSGAGNLTWQTTCNQTWLTSTPTWGPDAGTVYVSVDNRGLSAGTYSGTITVSSSLASNSPQTVNVTLTVAATSTGAGPFGSLDTPIEGNTVSGSIAVTGWALDDLGIQSVQLMIENGNELTYVGDAVFVEGARPDVQALYPGYPNSSKAGWGYMLLTHFLPGGDGIHKLYVVATDMEGIQTTLGTRTIIVDNAHAQKPFGAIDTPLQGGTANGTQYLNFGWALTPTPNTIPVDGSSIQVWVDGVQKGNPVYNQYREDIATLFPGYNNSNGAVGYFYLNTAMYNNGVHTIQWTVTDNAGNTDGIGSRYFSIQNNARVTALVSDLQGDTSLNNLRVLETGSFDPVLVTKGYGKTSFDAILPNDEGIIEIEMYQLERLEVHFETTRLLALSAMPIGSTVDADKSIFYWQPGVGFLGTYRLDFRVTDSLGNMSMKRLSITIKPEH